jgi:glycosyltransferase involved in cell wall biosynthesis
MRIAYVCYWNAYIEDGITAKVVAQLRRWRARGHHAALFCVTPKPRHPGSPALPATAIFPFTSQYGRAAATSALFRAVRAHSPDLLYLRYDLFLPPPVRALRRFTSVVELNTDDRIEYALRGRRVRAYNAVHRRLVLDAADGLVCVTHELADRHTSFGKPTAVIANGVELQRIPAERDRSAAPPPPSARSRVVFLAGRPEPWQGIDKVLQLARAVPEWEFVVAGEGLAAGRPLPNVEMHGLMAREDYARLLAECDLALGTLALHRKGMDEASPLKVREYLAHGLPVVITHRDTDFHGRDPWFLLQLGNYEANVTDGIDAIRAFGERVRGRRVAREEVAPLIDVDLKEDARLGFFESLLAGVSSAS